MLYFFSLSSRQKHLIPTHVEPNKKVYHRKFIKIGDIINYLIPVHMRQYLVVEDDASNVTTMNSNSVKNKNATLIFQFSESIFKIVYNEKPCL